MLKPLLLVSLIAYALSLTSYTIGNVTVTSNDPTYGPTEVLQDLQDAINYAQDQGNLGNDTMETVAAIMSAAGLLYPELPTKNICRVIMGDIKAETDYIPTEISPGRDGSGPAYGLMQVSPGGDSKELAFFKKHFNDSSLLDWKTGQPVNLKTLKRKDLLRPWINIHVASWFQSNLARSGSSDPSKWATHDFDGGKPTTVETGLGSWVAGPADDSDGYETSGDNMSGPYFQNILEIVSYLEGSQQDDSYLANLVVQPNIIYYK